MEKNPKAKPKRKTVYIRKSTHPRAKLAAIISAIILVSVMVSAITAFVVLKTATNQTVYGNGRILVPQYLNVYPTQIQWGSIWVVSQNPFSQSQTIYVMNNGLVPLRLQAFAVDNTSTPTWFQDGVDWLMGWSADGYVIQPGQNISTTFTLLVLGTPTEEQMIAANTSELEFSFNINMEAATWSTGKTFVQYTTEDYAAAQLIAENQSIPLQEGIHVALGLKNPAVFDPLYDENNVIAVGGYLANPYVAYYFPEYTISNGVFVGGPGISSDGTYVIAEKTRSSGYNITAVFGLNAPDTYNAALKYISQITKPPPPTQQYFLTITVLGNGTTSPAPGVYPYSKGSTATVNAVPNTGYALNNWTLDEAYTGNASTVFVNMNGNHTLTAGFNAVPTTGPPSIPNDEPDIRVEPIWTVNSSLGIGSTFTISIYLYNATQELVPNGVGGIEVHLDWNTSILNATSFTNYIGAAGGALAGNSIIYALGPNIINNGSEYEVAGASTTGGWWGSGTVATITFKVLAVGKTSLTLSYTDIADTMSNSVAHYAQSGLFDNT